VGSAGLSNGAGQYHAVRPRATTTKTNRISQRVIMSGMKGMEPLGALLSPSGSASPDGKKVEVNGNQQDQQTGQEQRVENVESVSATIPVRGPPCSSAQGEITKHGTDEMMLLRTWVVQ